MIFTSLQNKISAFFPLDFIQEKTLKGIISPAKPDRALKRCIKVWFSYVELVVPLLIEKQVLDNAILFDPQSVDKSWLHNLATSQSVDWG